MSTGETERKPKWIVDELNDSVDSINPDIVNTIIKADVSIHPVDEENLTHIVLSDN